MNYRYLIGGLLIIAFIVIAILNLNENQTYVKNLTEAQTSNQIVQVIGFWQKEMETNYDSKNNKFSFYIKDEKNNLAKVIYNGAKPVNFEMADRVVIKGKYHDNIFMAEHILTKCPSKYEGKEEDVLKTRV